MSTEKVLINKAICAMNTGKVFHKNLGHLEVLGTAVMTERNGR